VVRRCVQQQRGALGEGKVALERRRHCREGQAHNAAARGVMFDSHFSFRSEKTVNARLGDLLQNEKGK
jgi:hypothetical protein